MSAEKEIVNYWYNKRGFFTINNIKTSSNRDCGILALKLDNDKINEVFHIEVSCSITNNIPETTNLNKTISRIVYEKFENKSVAETVNNSVKQLSVQKSKIKKIIVLGAVPKSRKIEIIKEFESKEVEVVEFENILFDVFEQLDTQYYRNDIIRTLQLTKFLLLSEPTKLAKFLVNDAFSQSSRKEFLSNILDKNEIMKEFKKTNSERLASILKSSKMKPEDLAKMLNRSILNKRTRKVFFDSLTEQEKIRKVVGKIIKKKKNNVTLENFFQNF